MEDTKKEIHLHHETKRVAGRKVESLKDQEGTVKFLKVGFRPWEKVTIGDKE